MADVAALVLAAGLGSRFGAHAGESKVTALLDGKPLVRHVVETALRANATPVIVVTGHAGILVRAALEGLDVMVVRNPDYASGMASSLKVGVVAVPKTCGATLVLLADMPLVRSQTCERLIEAFAKDGTADAVVPTFEGRAGNPVLLARRFFADLATLEGDSGARGLLGQSGRFVIERSVEDPGILRDIDTRAALRAVDTVR